MSANFACLGKIKQGIFQTGFRGEKICPTYFKISQTYFEIRALYFFLASMWD